MRWFGESGEYEADLAMPEAEFLANLSVRSWRCFQIVSFLNMAFFERFRGWIDA